MQVGGGILVSLCSTTYLVLSKQVPLVFPTLHITATCWFQSLPVLAAASEGREASNQCMQTCLGEFAVKFIF